MTNSELIIEGDFERDSNGNARFPGRSAAATVKHIALMAQHLRAEWGVTAEQASMAANALHNLHGFTLSKLQRARGPLTGEIIFNAIQNTK